MKIISGKYKNKQIISPKDSSVRPTTDKVRGAIFSSLFDEIIDKDVLDLCCGTGAFGIEALSRGASSATLVDVKPELAKKNIKDVDNIKVVKKDATQFIEQTGEVFDIIFVDPPYGKIDSEKLIQSIHDKEILANDGILIYEESVRTPFRIPENTFKIYNEKKYGDTKIYYLSVIR